MLNDKRLEIESALLAAYFPNVKIQGTRGQPDHCALGWVRTMGGTWYPVWLPLGKFPAAPPPLHVLTPLKTPLGQNLADLGVRHDWHTLAPQAGHVRICHYTSSKWTESVTLYKVLIKGLVWLQCYEAALARGGTVDTFVRTMA